MANQLRQMTNEAQLAGRVTFTGQVTDEEKMLTFAALIF